MENNEKKLCILVPEYCTTNKSIQYDEDSTLLDIIPKVLRVRDEFETQSLGEQFYSLKLNTTGS